MAHAHVWRLYTKTNLYVVGLPRNGCLRWPIKDVLFGNAIGTLLGWAVGK